jgi:hypothetical protein
VKQASSAQTVALEEYRRNVAAFRDLYVAEIQSVRRTLGQALVSRWVTREITAASGEGGTFDDMSDEIREQGLIAVSQQIEESQRGARAFVELLLAAKIECTGEACDAAVDAKLDELTRPDPVTVETFKTQLEAATDPAEQARLQAIVATLEADPQAKFGDEILGYAKRILEWGILAESIPKNLENLDNVIAALQVTHGTVDAWIQTDVMPDGKQLAELVQKHKDTLGLGGGSEGE